MIPTDSNYMSTIHVDQIRTEVLENMIIYMHNQIEKINKELIAVTKELAQRKS
jgi:hypothetical protein